MTQEWVLIRKFMYVNAISSIVNFRSKFFYDQK